MFVHLLCFLLKLVVKSKDNELNESKIGDCVGMVYYVRDNYCMDRST